MQDIFIKVILERGKISKYICIYVNDFDVFYINLVFLSFASESMTIASCISAIRAPVELITFFIIICFKLSDRFVNLVLC